jgi:hypothetical protein
MERQSEVVCLRPDEESTVASDVPVVTWEWEKGRRGEGCSCSAPGQQRSQEVIDLLGTR